MKRRILLIISIGLFLTVSACGQKKIAPVKQLNVSKLFGVNLIKNGGAEFGNSAPWKSGDDLKTFDYNGGWGDAWQVTPPNKGEKYFYVTVTAANPISNFTQEFDVSEIAETIDANRVGYDLGAWFGVRGASAGKLKVEFYDANKNLISRPKDTDATEEITMANKPNDVSMIEKTFRGDVPNKTRKIKVTLEFYLFEDRKSENEGETAIADNLSLVLMNEGDK